MKLVQLRLTRGLAAAVLLALAACTQGPQSSIEQPSPSVVAQVASSQGTAAPAPQVVPPCQGADPGQAVYADPDQRYCFVFPNDFRIGEVTTNTVSLQNPQVTETTPVLNVRWEPAPPGKSLTQIVDERLLRAKGQQPNLLVKRQAVELNGHAGEEVIGLPGRPDGHWLFLLQDGDLMTLLFRPSRGATDAARSLEQSLWQQVTTSLRFLEKRGD